VDLSGGELQRFAIAMACIQKADMCVAARACVNGLGSPLLNLRPAASGAA